MPEFSPAGSRRSAAVASLAGNAGTTLVASLQALLLVPLYLHELGPRLYGAWLASGDVLLWLQSFDLGLPNVMIQRIAFAHGRGDQRTASEYFATGTAILGVLSASVVALLFWGAPAVPRWLNLTGADATLLTRCVRLGAVASGLTLLNWAVVGYSRAVQDTAAMNLAAVGASLVGFGVTVVLLLCGFGLWSLVFGSCARAIGSVFGSVAYLISRGRDGRFTRLRIRRAAAVDLLSLSPSTALAGIGYALMNQSENAIVGVMLGPDRVPILAITRKGADVLRGLLDMIGFATYGGFAHLVASTDRTRAPRVYGEIVSLNLSLGVASAAAYMVVNPSFVTRWVGGSFFGGPWLTLLMAGQLLTMSVSYLINYLYRASGRLVRGSVVLIAECVVRVPLMVLLASTIGLLGVPLAALITSSVSAVLVHTWEIAELSHLGDRIPLLASRVALFRVALFAVGAVGCVLLLVPSWPFVFSLGFTVFAASAVLLIGIDPLLVGVRATARGMFDSWRSRARERGWGIMQTSEAEH